MSSLPPLPSRSVAVVGAGPAGIGVALALQDAGIEDVQILERDRIGSSLRRWPREMRCITPSFMANSFGAVDLNAVSPSTSPAFSLDVEHPTGREWAAYLEGVAEHYELDVREGVTVDRVHEAGEDAFALETSAGLLRARNVVWAAGELGAPRLDAFPGCELCTPAGDLRSWADVTARDVTVIGGFESGIDGAVTLVAQRDDRRVTVLDPAAPWERRHDDPSRTLSPYTRARLDVAIATGRLELRSGVRVTGAEATRRGRLTLRCDGGHDVRCEAPPVLATGYGPVLGPVERLFEVGDDGAPVLTGDDESTRTPGLFLAGPSVRHDGLIFCFAYKFRGRFPVVAQAICGRLGLEADDGLQTWRAAGMWVDDLACCGEACVC